MWLTLVLCISAVPAIIWTSAMLGRAQLPLATRLARSWAPLALWFWVAMSLLRVLELPLTTGSWHGCRLAPVVAMKQGVPLYNGPDSGPITSHIYGPVWPIAMLPATLGKTPTSIILIGGALTFAWFFVPLFILIRRGTSASPLMPAAFLACAIWALHDDPLQGSAYWVHVDAVALGLGALACAALIPRDAALSPSTGALLASAAATALAVWTKQTFAPMLLVLPAFLWIRDGRRIALRYAVLIAVVIVPLSAGFAWIFGLSNMIFNMFVVPSHHPFKQQPPVVALLGAAVSALVHCVAPLALLYAASMLGQDRRIRPLRDWLGRTPAALPGILGLAMLPTAMLGYAKFGGHGNNLSNVVYFLLASGAIAIARQTSIKAPALLGLMCLIGAPLALGNPARLIGRLRAAADFTQNPQELVYRYALAHPGQAYFPWNTLSTLLADGTLYHMEWGLIDRILAGYSPSQQHLAEGMPPNLRLIAAPRDLPNRAAPPKGIAPTRLDDLPGFDVYLIPAVADDR